MDEKEKDSRDNYMSKSSFADGRRPILVFRVGVIAVLAANRIHHFAAVSSRVFISTECPGEIGGLSAVLCGGVGKTRRPFKGKWLNYCSCGGVNCKLILSLECTDIKIFHLNGRTLSFRLRVQNYKLLPPLECTHQKLSFE